MITLMVFNVYMITFSKYNGINSVETYLEKFKCLSTK